ncbi:MAG TPA: J domain-containing protein [Gammaproteobacteria bacterium]|nr:J domain-containing protein [Gammaproteobacteria bacterium]
MNTPEETELNRLEAEQADLTEQLATSELELENTQTNLQRFRIRYYEGVGRLYVEMDSMDARIAALHAERNPADADLRREAEELRVRAEESASEVGVDASAPVPPPPVIDADTRAAYRRAAMLMHPDRATMDAERDRRNGFMARLNKAYEAGDLEQIQIIMSEFGSDPEAVAGGDVGSRIVKALRRIAQIRKRLAAIEEEMAALQQDDMYLLMQSVQETEAMGVDPLKELAEDLLRQISERRIEIEVLLAEEGEGFA